MTDRHDSQGVVVEGYREEAAQVVAILRRAAPTTSLDLPKEAGDYGTIDLEEGSWWRHRRYYSADGSSKGDIYNINTPVEFYPRQVRYVDLEVDVVLPPGGGIIVVDEPALEQSVTQGLLPRLLAEKARGLARELVERLLP